VTWLVADPTQRLRRAARAWTVVSHGGTRPASGVFKKTAKG